MHWLQTIIVKQAQWDQEEEGGSGLFGWISKLPSAVVENVSDFIKYTGRSWKYPNLSLQELHDIYLTPQEWLEQHPGSKMTDFLRWRNGVDKKKFDKILPSNISRRWQQQTRNRLFKQMFGTSKRRK